MPVVEQNIIIQAPVSIVMQTLQDVEQIPAWATVAGTIDNVKGRGLGMTYEWHYAINQLSFSGKSEVIEQTDALLITKTTGDVDSLWSITLTPLGKNSTAMRVVVEYSHPNIFVEVLADIVLQQLANPDVARENMARFKAAAETRARALAAQMLANR